MLKLIPEHTSIYLINYVAMGLEFQCMCVCGYVCVSEGGGPTVKGGVCIQWHTHTLKDSQRSQLKISQ